MRTRSRGGLTRLGAGLTGAMLLMAGSCGMTTVSGGTDAACAAFRPISWSVLDTDDSIRQIKGHNAAYQANCPVR